MTKASPWAGGPGEHLAQGFEPPADAPMPTTGPVKAWDSPDPALSRIAEAVPSTSSRKSWSIEIREGELRLCHRGNGVRDRHQ